LWSTVRQTVIFNCFYINLFAVGENQRVTVGTMPGVERLSIDLLVPAVKEAADLGIPAIAIFPATDPDLKDEMASEAVNKDNLVCRTVKAIKAAGIDISIMCDVALDPYTSHGQDGLLATEGPLAADNYVDNDTSVAMLCRQSVVQAQAGCDIIAPSDMMDGRIGAIREALDKEGFGHVQIMSYAAKYASAFFGPFR